MDETSGGGILVGMSEKNKGAVYLGRLRQKKFRKGKTKKEISEYFRALRQIGIDNKLAQSRGVEDTLQ
jgi:hypothetical protein